MPELPEVEVVANSLKNKICGCKICEVIVNNRKFRAPVPDDIEQTLCGATILSVKRIAKYIIVDLDNQNSIIWHLGMSGKIFVFEKKPETFAKHDHIAIITDKCCLVFNDARRFGLFTTDKTENLKTNRFLKNTGIDPFDDKLDAKYLFEKLRSKKTAIKLCLLEQDIINGIGNIYASEILFDCGINPLRPADKVSLDECQKIIDSTRKILQKAIDAGGSTLRDNHHIDVSEGHFQGMHCVYGKEGLSCPDCCCDICKTGGIQKIVQGGRSTYFCPKKQK